MVPDSPDVRLVVEGPDGLFDGIRAGSVLVDMSTIAPAVARDLAGKAAERGVQMLDAPVSGGEVGAINGTLSIMVGGDGAALERVRPVLNAMGNPERVVHIDPPAQVRSARPATRLHRGALASVSEGLR